jgi:hypothetical protein
MTSTDKAQVEGQSCGQTEDRTARVMPGRIEQIADYWKYRIFTVRRVPAIFAPAGEARMPGTRPAMTDR